MNQTSLHNAKRGVHQSIAAVTKRKETGIRRQMATRDDVRGDIFEVSQRFNCIDTSKVQIAGGAEGPHARLTHLMTIAIQMINTRSVERRGSTNDPVYLVVLRQK